MNDECKDYLVRQDMLVRSSNTIPKNVKTKTYIELITSWHHDRNLIEGSTDIAQFAKLIQEENKIDIKPSMIQPVEEIKSLGKFKVKISLHSEVDVEITINVTSADTIQ